MLSPLTQVQHRQAFGNHQTLPVNWENNAGFQDTYLAPVPNGTSVSGFVQSIADATPKWMHGLFHLHDFASKPLGEKQQRYPYIQESIRIGDKIGPFPIISISNDTVECGRHDKNLDFKSTYRLYTLPNGQRMVGCTTVVRFRNKRGKAYFQVLKLFHKWLLPRLIRQITTEPPLHLPGISLQTNETAS